MAETKRIQQKPNQIKFLIFTIIFILMLGYQIYGYRKDNNEIQKMNETINELNKRIENMENKFSSLVGQIKEWSQYEQWGGSKFNEDNF